MRNYITFDIGGTFIKYAIMNENAEKLESGKFRTPTVLGDFINQIESVTAEFKVKYKLSGVAVSAPGAVDVSTGIIGGSSTIPYIHHFCMTDLITEKTELPVSIENDANCAALAEGWIGAAKDVSYFLCVVIGTDIGGSVVMNNKIIRGKNLHGGEFGLMFLENDKKVLLGNTWGCTSSTVALIRDVEEKMGLTSGSMNGELVFQQLNDGNQKVAECLNNWYFRLALGIYNLQYCFDPEKILVGGGISKRPEVIEGINNALKQMKDEVSTLDVTVETCAFENDANLIGALYHFLESKSS